MAVREKNYRGVKRGMESASTTPVDTTRQKKTGEQWEFRREPSVDGRARWRWQRRGRDGSILASSINDFPSLLAAIEDAGDNGFRYGK
jgi:hypothetical protein